MPTSKYSITDARICKCLRSFGASYSKIAKWTGIQKQSVVYQCKHRKSVPKDSDESARQLLLWWIDQKFPSTPQVADDHGS